MKPFMPAHCLLTLLLVFCAASLPVAGQDGTQQKTKSETAAKAATQPEWAELFGGASMPVVWQSASAASEKIDQALVARKLEGVAVWAETIHLAAHALEDQVKVADADRAVRLKGALGQAARLADAVLDGANHDKIEQTADAHRRLKAALSLTKSRLPKDVVDAAPQTPRFAKASGHAHDEKGGQVEKKK